MKTLLIGTIFGVSMTIISINIFAYMVRQTENDIKSALKITGNPKDKPEIEEL